MTAIDDGSGGPMAQRSDRLNVILLGDSVCLNYLDAIGGGFISLFPDEIGTGGLAEFLCQELRRSDVREVDVVEICAVNRTITGSIACIRATDLEDASAVIVAHGGLESILVPPKGLRKLACHRRPLPRAWQRNNLEVLLDCIRRPIWGVICRATWAYPTVLGRILYAVGYRLRMRPELYEEGLRALVEAVRERSSAPILFLESPGVSRSHSMLLPLPQALHATWKATERVARESADVYAIPRPGEFDSGRYFLTDGCHLNRKGRGTWAKIVAKALHDVSSNSVDLQGGD